MHRACSVFCNVHSSGKPSWRPPVFLHTASTPRAIEKTPCTARARFSATFIHQVSPAGAARFPAHGIDAACYRTNTVHRACAMFRRVHSLPERLRVAAGHLVSPSSFRPPWPTRLSRSQRRSPARASPSNRPASASATRAASTSSLVATPPCTLHPGVPPQHARLHFTVTRSVAPLPCRPSGHRSAHAFQPRWRHRPGARRHPHTDR
ncbi:hypothetical protein BLA6863_06797 [Burkholderia lata]|uniref:Uncharacterized protein n=1 Tax=Burkholderia lata (strain ATCC 17760 / DSM 23089 / LMG 22485 / NCIMB 9086 / R18194 / 383) TaxID=482957 RepID=A0A6P2S4K5_BURL3|nr:hypothetical protein BLA6863_06797 [Burkholderia lata]